jgi:hypothetical protein
MVVSQAERAELIRRVSRQVEGAVSDAALVRGAVDRVIAALADRDVPAPAADRVVVVTAESTPDLASRLRAAVGSREVMREVAVATEGRHTVLVARVAAAQVEPMRASVERIGARFVVREQA